MFVRDDLRAIAHKVRSKVFDACDQPVDVIVSNDPTHVGYLCGYRSLLLDLMRDYRTAAIVTRETAVLVTGASDVAAALEVLRDPAGIYRYGVFFFETSNATGLDFSALPKLEATFADALRAAIAATIKPQQRVGLDCASARELQELQNLAGARSFDARPAIMKARRTKLSDEIQKIAHAAAIAERGLEKAFAHARAGVTELELSAIIAGEMRAGGGVPRFVVVTRGERSALADAYATPAKLSNGDLVRFDIGCTVDGYWADMARTAVVGEPTREQEQRYAALLEGEQAQRALARSGVTAGDMFKVAVDRVRRGALPGYQRSHCGHGIGIEVYEYPTLNAASHAVELEEGMVLCVETPYYQIGWGGMMVEDMIVIRSAGNECLTQVSRELRRLP
ncbi:MAG TPA: Xaa-Pro peptidase family protein [Xanthobacteraceae bacterium]|jgi:Xaa-Pro aminopeptidase